MNFFKNAKSSPGRPFFFKLGNGAFPLSGGSRPPWGSFRGSWSEQKNQIKSTTKKKEKISLILFAAVHRFRPIRGVITRGHDPPIKNLEIIKKNKIKFGECFSFISLSFGQQPDGHSLSVVLFIRSVHWDAIRFCFVFLGFCCLSSAVASAGTRRPSATVALSGPISISNWDRRDLLVSVFLLFFSFLFLVFFFGVFF